jgi:sugar/nucleoside kinase (ribokinase family)
MGRWLRESLAKDGLNLDGVFLDPAGTRRSVNIMYRDGRRKNFYDGKGGMESRPDLDLCRSLLFRSRLAHFNIINWSRLLLPIARRAGIPLSCDLQDVVDPGDPYRLDYIAAADILFFSATNVEDPEPLVREFLHGRPGKIVVCGMGSRGCAVARKGYFRRFPAPALPEPVVDTNGAGDSLAVGFLVSYVFDGFGLEDSVLRGQIAARHACTLKGNSDLLITRRQLDTLYASARTGAPPSS